MSIWSNRERGLRDWYFKGGFEIGEGIDSVDLPSLDQRGDVAPYSTPFIVTLQYAFLRFRATGRVRFSKQLELISTRSPPGKSFRPFP